MGTRVDFLQLVAYISLWWVSYMLPYPSNLLETFLPL